MVDPRQHRAGQTAAGQAAIVQALVSNAGFKTITGTEADPIVMRVTLPQGFEEPEGESEGPQATAGPVTENGVLKRFPKILESTVASGLLTCPYVGVLPASETIRLTWTGRLNRARRSGPANSPSK